MMLASIVLPSPTSSARIARPPICRSTRWATSIWCCSSLMACPPNVMSRSKPGTSATCSASRRSSYQARGADGASSCLANSSNERSSTDQTETAESGICRDEKRGRNIQFATAPRQPLHGKRLPHSRRVHLPRHDIPEPRQPRRPRAHTVAQSRFLALDDLEHALRDLLRRNASRQGLAKLREHSLAGDVVRREFPLGLRRSLTNWGVHESRLDEAHTDAKRPDFVPQRFGISLDGKLRRRVEGAERNRGVARERADVNDLAGTGGPHPREHRIHHAHDDEEVRLELRLGFLDSRLFGGAHHRVPCVVDEHVQPARLRDHLFHARADRLVRSYVEREHRKRCALCRVRLACRPEYREPTLGQQLRRRLSDARRGARDENCLRHEISGRVCSPQRHMAAHRSVGAAWRTRSIRRLKPVLQRTVTNTLPLLRLLRIGVF